jgi:hypothetical protein
MYRKGEALKIMKHYTIMERSCIIHTFHKIKTASIPLSIFTLFNAKTLECLFDNQAFVGFVPPQYFTHFLLQIFFFNNIYVMNFMTDN